MRLTSTALFGYGFRPFFLGVSVLAAVLIPWWAVSLVWGARLASGWPLAMLAALWVPGRIAVSTAAVWTADLAFYRGTARADAALSRHALTVGAAGMMIVAVMTRASPGHTGRPLLVTRSTAYAYGLLA